MNIGIIVYSQTCNTLSVAEKVLETCTAAGYTAEIQRITVANADKEDHVVLTNAPVVTGYDAVIFAAPVQAFSLCAPMREYLKQVSSLSGIPVGCYITQALPKLWMGGNRAHKTMRSLCLKKGAEPVRLGHVHWKSAQRNEQIAAIVSAAVKFAATAK